MSKPIIIVKLRHCYTKFPLTIFQSTPSISKGCLSCDETAHLLETEEEREREREKQTDRESKRIIRKQRERLKKMVNERDRVTAREWISFKLKVRSHLCQVEWLWILKLDFVFSLFLCVCVCVCVCVYVCVYVCVCVLCISLAVAPSFWDWFLMWYSALTLSTLINVSLCLCVSMSESVFVCLSLYLSEHSSKNPHYVHPGNLLSCCIFIEAKTSFGLIRVWWPTKLNLANDTKRGEAGCYIICRSLLCVHKRSFCDTSKTEDWMLHWRYLCWCGRVCWWSLSFGS